MIWVCVAAAVFLWAAGTLWLRWAERSSRLDYDKRPSRMKRLIISEPTKDTPTHD